MIQTPRKSSVSTRSFEIASDKNEKINQELMEKYNTVIEDQLEKGMIEKVESRDTSNIRHYIPHHAVLKPDKATTKLRIVYDASAKYKKKRTIA